MLAGNRQTMVYLMLFPGDWNIFRQGNRQDRALLHHISHWCNVLGGYDLGLQSGSSEQGLLSVCSRVPPKDEFCL